eukprot:COSAG02_NODE_1998_length_10148_cov_30.517663_6_plen_86_part_00
MSARYVRRYNHGMHQQILLDRIWSVKTHATSSPPTSNHLYRMGSPCCGNRPTSSLGQEAMIKKQSEQVARRRSRRSRCIWNSSCG